ncbi:uncharacterized protein LOC126759318 [Bactrocera neohumeralis]|uniref:uncharacterized protein LOC126759318 n=1 Tax=Bactrocera neohumeralis TaxID=98809 RepID=UPI0021658537|nr:uncharacterized protein LOC126759318 [Bactrocera neohumeralis]
MNSDDEVFEGIMDNVIDETISSTPSKTKRRKKPQIVSSWTNESTTNLIQAIEMYNCIWEYSCPEYKDRAKRDKAWNDIVEKFPTQEVDGCKAKWANIKTAFSNVKKKMTTKSGQAAGKALPHWPFWSAMQFYCLHDRCKSSSSVSTLDVDADVTPPPTAARSDTKSKPSATDESVTTDAMETAIQFLNKEEDHWHGVGMYLALQMRELSKRNKRAATKLHAELIQVAMNAVLQQDEENLS